MEVLERIDEILPDGTVFTKKVMANGEERTRIKYDDGSSVSKTKAKQWELDQGQETMPWQDAHFHKGKTEVYAQISGWSAYIWKDENGDVWSDVMCGLGETKTFSPNVQHVVLLGPGAEISTLLFGEPIGNPNRKDNDWWYVSGKFAFEISGAMNDLELKIRSEFLF